jgi:predicted metal-dependent hydrolase
VILHEVAHHLEQDLDGHRAEFASCLLDFSSTLPQAKNLPMQFQGAYRYKGVKVVGKNKPVTSTMP